MPSCLPRLTVKLDCECISWVHRISPSLNHRADHIRSLQKILMQGFVADTLSGSAGLNVVKAVLPSSRALITPLRRVLFAITCSFNMGIIAMRNAGDSISTGGTRTTQGSSDILRPPPDYATFFLGGMRCHAERSRNLGRWTQSHVPGDDRSLRLRLPVRRILIPENLFSEETNA